MTITEALKWLAAQDHIPILDGIGEAGPGCWGAMPSDLAAHGESGRGSDGRLYVMISDPASDSDDRALLVVYDESAFTADAARASAPAPPITSEEREEWAKNEALARKAMGYEARNPGRGRDNAGAWRDD